MSHGSPFVASRQEVLVLALLRTSYENRHYRMTWTASDDREWEPAVSVPLTPICT